MQWTSGKNCGFSTSDFSKLYLPIDTSKNAPNVATEEQDPNSLLNRVKKLIQLKQNEPALAAYAEFIPLYAKENSYPLVYARANCNDIVLVILNPSGQPATAEFPVNISGKSFQLLAGNKISITQKKSSMHIDIPGITYSVYKVK
jgi:glycosidase